MQDVVVLTMSEFGRAVVENGNRGTDHGHGNAMMIIGGPVRGGKVYGHWPGLAREQRYDGRDLSVTTDFRSVFTEVVHGHLGLTDTRPVFPGFTATSTLGFFNFRGALPLGLPYTLSRAPLRRRAPFAWLTRCRSLASSVFVCRARLGL